MEKLVNSSDLKSDVERLDGSSPSTRTNCPVSSVDRASVFYTVGREFESLTGRQK